MIFDRAAEEDHEQAFGHPLSPGYGATTAGTTLQAESQIEAAPADVCQELPFAEMFAAPAAAD